MKIALTRVHVIDARRSEPMPVIRPRHLQKKNPWEHSPTRTKKTEIETIKGVVR